MCYSSLDYFCSVTRPRSYVFFLVDRPIWLYQYDNRQPVLQHPYVVGVQKHDSEGRNRTGSLLRITLIVIGVVSMLLFWPMMEMGVALFVCCLPTMRPLFLYASIESMINSIRLARRKLSLRIRPTDDLSHEVLRLPRNSESNKVSWRTGVEQEVNDAFDTYHNVETQSCGIRPSSTWVLWNTLDSGKTRIERDSMQTMETV